ncbi:arsenate reductase family protein [Xanthovirga aplysinae]|uniref:arsenate reductase family protein n=1 Tax=Xanthovirga aplysinae TaxID=2529853 RepID=UPI0016570D4A|nr:glutaredoxin [Xanthovirga aplysinae]MTI29732.1 glutaredoxin [Xanthovirga aplysinae]
MHPNELYLLFDPESRDGKSTRAYAYSITPHVNENYYSSAQMTSTFWRELLDMLDLTPKEILNRAHPLYQAKIAGNAFDDEGWLNILKEYPYMIKAPIAIKENRAIFCKTPTDILRLAKATKTSE